MTGNHGSSIWPTIAGLGFLFVIGGCILYFQDVKTFRMQRQVSSSFLKLGGLLNLEAIQNDPLSGDLSSVVKRVRLDVGTTIYDEYNQNPFPEWLPDYKYIINKDKGQAPDGVLITASFFYWLEHDVDIVLYWNGKTEMRGHR